MIIGKFPDATGADTGMYLEGNLDEFYLFDTVRDESHVEKLMEKCDFSTGGKKTDRKLFPASEKKIIESKVHERFVSRNLRSLLCLSRHP